MIVKKVIRKDVNKSSYKRLINYLTGNQSIENRVMSVNFSNLQNDDIKLCLQEVQTVQEMNTRTKKDKTYHFIFSFPEGERPDLDTLKQIEDRFVKALGYEDHQRISVVHGDTDNYHVHVAINKIHPITHHAIEPKNDFFKLSQERKLVEKDYGLINTDKQKKIHHKSNDIEKVRNVQSLVSYVKNNCLNVFEKSMSWEDLQKGLLEYGLKIKERGNGMVVATNDDRLFIKLSSIDRKISKKNLIEKLGQFKGVDDLGIDINSITQISTYKEDPLNFSSQSTKLYEAYKKEQSNNIYIRNKEISWLKNNRELEIKAIRAKYKGARKLVKLMGGNPFLMKMAYKLLYSQMKLEFQSTYKKFEKEKELIYTTYKRRSWDEYLVNTAKNGNLDSLNILRDKNKYSETNREKLKKGNSISSDNTFVSKNQLISLQDQIDHITKNGTILIKGKDNKIRIKKSGVYLNEHPSYKAIEKSLFISLQKFGNELEIKGDNEFKAAIIIVANKHKLDIKFKDDSMNFLLEKLKEREVSNGRGPIRSGVAERIKLNDGGRDRESGFSRTIRNFGRTTEEAGRSSRARNTRDARARGSSTLTGPNDNKAQKWANEADVISRIKDTGRRESQYTPEFKCSLPLLSICDMDGFRKGNKLLLSGNLPNNLGLKETERKKSDNLRWSISRSRLIPPGQIINGMNNTQKKKNVLKTK